MTSKDIYQIEKVVPLKRKKNRSLRNFRKRKKTLTDLNKNINKWQTSTCHGYIIQPSRQRIKKRLLKY